MRQARTVLSTYSADVFGVCSALYELGGMVVMHDASGCNSTYSTHDEPRWYGSDSLIFISGLTEMDAVMGNDEKLINDMLDAIGRLHPRFAAVASTPIPVMTGCDLEAIAAEIERKSGIPCFGFNTDSMNSYVFGASEALAEYARRMTDRSAKKRKGTVNIIGATPLDFSLSGTVESIRSILEEDGWEVIGTWAMGSTPEELARAGEAEVNLVISGLGVKTANVLKELYGTPYVVGTPVGRAFSNEILHLLRLSAEDGVDRIAFSGKGADAPDAGPEAGAEKIYIIGESVLSRSFAAAVYLETGKKAAVVSAMECEPELSEVLGEGDVTSLEEEEIRQICSDADIVIADPLYIPVMPEKCRFVSAPHEAFSGRMFRKNIPDLTKLVMNDLIGGK